MFTGKNCNPAALVIGMVKLDPIKRSREPNSLVSLDIRGGHPLIQKWTKVFHSETAQAGLIYD